MCGRVYALSHILYSAFAKWIGDTMKNNDLYISERIKRNGFVNGIYFPYFVGNWYGRDIGTSIHHGYSGDSCFNEQCIRRAFYNAKAMGFEMAKLWLNEGFEGMHYDEKGNFLGVEPLFLKNLERTFQIAQEVGLNISVCLCDHHESCFTNYKFKYDKYSRFRQVPSETEKYIKTYVYPILELGKKYGLELVDIYAEPEADGGLWPVTRGVAWVSMKRFINQVAKAVKDFDPRLATTVSSGSADRTILAGRYSDVDVDFYGCDIYNDGGSFANTRDMLLERPIMLGEYGVNVSAKKTDKEQAEVIKRYRNNFKNYGVAGGFYWCYGYYGSNSQYHLVDKEGKLKNVGAFLHFDSIDRENAITGNKEKDIPCMIMTCGTDNLQWFGSRGATEYSLEYKVGNEWKELARVKQEEYEEYPGIFNYSHEDSGELETYRVTAFFDDGSSVLSPELTLEKKVEFK